ncbi:MAG: nitrile hydratase accessory protein, partial [Pseudomonadota bacterium]|nr:nitrile hydratase accessory protein [Pseudomonadota bacterium]
MSDPAGFDPDQVFSSVWHAQLFGLTVHLYDQGVFTWAEWSAALGRQLRDDRHISSGQPSGHTQEDRYYLAWLAALTACLQDKAITDPQ